jgi:hypothetical protein
MSAINPDVSPWMLFSRFNLVLLVFILWLLAQLVVPIKFIPYFLLSKLEILKTLIPAIGIVVCTLLYVDKVRLNGKMKAFYLFSAFGLIKSCILFFTLSMNLEYFINPLMYTLWVLIMFITAPSIFNSLSKIRIFLRCMIVTFSIVAVICLWFVVYFGIDVELLYRGGRLTFVYGNPLYLGGVAYSIICCSLMLTELSKSAVERNLLYLLLVVCFWVILESYSRTFLAGVFVLLVVYLFNKLVHYRGVLVLLTLACSTSFIFVYLFQIINSESLSANALNSLSSGRFGNWSLAFQQSMDGLNALWGGDGTSNYDKSLDAADGDSVDVTFQRYSIDNTYIEIFINSGLIGISLFLWGLVSIFRIISLSSLRKTKNGENLIGILSISHAIFTSVVVSGLFYGHYPSLGNTINAVVLPAVLSVIFLVNRHTIASKKGNY